MRHKAHIYNYNISQMFIQKVRKLRKKKLFLDKKNLKKIKKKLFITKKIY